MHRLACIYVATTAALQMPRRARPAAAVRGGALAAVPSASSKVLAVAAGAVSRLVVTTGVGAATVKGGLITPDQINALAKVVYNFFLPCFLFCAVVRTVASYGLSPELLLLMPAAAVAQIGIAFFVSRYVIVPLVGAAPRSGAAREICLSGSFGNPGVLPLLFFDALFAASPDPSLLPRLTALCSFYLMGFTPAFWALGNAILADDDPDAACLTAGSFDECVGPTRLEKARKAVAAGLRPPPVAAALLGLLVAASPFRQAFVGSSVYAALTRFSGGYLPSASLVLAGSLIAGGGEREGGAVDFNRIVALCLHRFCLLPALGAGALAGLASVGLFPKPRASPLTWFFLLTQFAMPPAQNTVVMYQLRNDPVAATRQAKTLLALYAASVVPLALLF
eukprot:CAMPEP_0119269696 /NCGR_PEP_ID=MMETSP1329-20130426/6999_1 /TAXON_ID=114041 /ORGANISM="Genus nov. species nov., Strain RCC1024" /LENGTH=393 /DNA_ID=CAMNT_0007269697 /DNA_START=127 /DNA_END=1305 /DNA_ORIENTATION=-